MKAVKFTFDNNFSPRQGATGNGTGRIYRPEPKYDAKAVEEIRQQTFQEGMTAGRQEADNEIAAHAAQSLDRIGNALQSLVEGEDSRRQTARKEIARIAFLIAGKLAPALISRHPLADIEALVTECLVTCEKEPKLVISVNAGLVEDMEDRIADLKQRQHFAGEIVLMGDAEIATGDCRIEWHDGGAERNSQNLEDEIEKIIDRYIHAVDLNRNLNNQTDDAVPDQACDSVN